MDPDAALRELREIVAVITGYNGPPRYLEPEQQTHIAELFDGLDQWLTSGGFKPAAWRAPKPY